MIVWRRLTARGPDAEGRGSLVSLGTSGCARPCIAMLACAHSVVGNVSGGDGGDRSLMATPSYDAVHCRCSDCRHGG